MRTACLIVLVLLLGCGGGQKPVPPKAENYFPMATGYSWKYSTTEISYLDSVRAETTARVGSLELRCIGRKPMPNGREAWALHRNMGSFTDTTFADQTDSLALYWNVRDWDHPNTELVLPLRPGRSWIVLGGKLSSTQATAVRQESVKVPAGEYAQAWRIEDSTVHADGKTSPMRGVRWFAAGVGLVRTETEIIRSNGTRLRTIDELVSAKTGK